MSNVQIHVKFNACYVIGKSEGPHNNILFGEKL